MNSFLLRGLSIFAFLGLPLSSLAQFPSAIPQYSPTTKVIQGQLPFTPGAVPDPVNPVNPYTLSITSPIGVVYPQTITVKVNIATVGNVVGGVKALPAGVSDAVALSYVIANPATLTFTAPSQTFSTIVSVKIDPTQAGTATVGDYGYVINTAGFPASVVVTDPVTGGPVGSTINLTVQPAPPSPTPPTISNILPLNGTNFTYDPAVGAPISFPISFNADVINGLSSDGITALSATIDGYPFDGAASFPDSASSTLQILQNLQRTGLATLHARGTVQSPNITDGGPHVIVLTAKNNGTNGDTKTTTINVHTPPKFTSASATSFTVGQAGSFAVTATGYSIPALSLTGGTLPAGVTFNPATGILSGTPTSAVGSPITLTFTANNDVRPVTQTFTLTINKANLTVKAIDATKVYGAANPAFSTTITGFVNGDTAAVVSGAAAFSTPATAASSAGNYAITPSVGTLAAANYNFIFVNGNLNVTKAVLSVTAANATKVYGAANPAFSATISGFVNGDGAAAVSGAAAVASTATNASPVGNYSITPTVGTLSAANYSFTFANGSLAVTRAPLTVTADNATKVVGAANPAFTATISGFVNGDTSATAVSGAPAFTTTATTASVAGTYPITPALGTLASTNYSFASFVAGTLTVSGKLDQTITFGALDSKLLGSGTFALTATASSGLAVTYTSSNPAVATVSGSTVTLVSVGTTVIPASQGGNATYNAAVPVPQTLTVTAAQTCPTTIMWLTPISLNKVRQGGSVLPIMFELQQCCGVTPRDPDCNGDYHSDDHNGNGDEDDDGSHDDDARGWRNSDHSGSNVTCRHGNDGHSSNYQGCRHDVEHDDDDNKG